MAPGRGRRHSKPPSGSAVIGRHGHPPLKSLEACRSRVAGRGDCRVSTGDAVVAHVPTFMMIGAGSSRLLVRGRRPRPPSPATSVARPGLIAAALVAGLFVSPQRGSSRGPCSAPHDSEEARARRVRRRCTHVRAVPDHLVHAVPPGVHRQPSGRFRFRSCSPRPRRGWPPATRSDLRAVAITARRCLRSRQQRHGWRRTAGCCGSATSGGGCSRGLAQRPQQPQHRRGRAARKARRGHEGSQ
jgi:hypothetical protein